MGTALLRSVQSTMRRLAPPANLTPSPTLLGTGVRVWHVHSRPPDRQDTQGALNRLISRWHHWRVM
jgi:hypothetical protein